MHFSDFFGLSYVLSQLCLWSRAWAGLLVSVGADLESNADAGLAAVKLESLKAKAKIWISSVPKGLTETDRRDSGQIQSCCWHDTDHGHVVQQLGLGGNEVLQSLPKFIYRSSKCICGQQRRSFTLDESNATIGKRCAAIALTFTQFCSASLFANLWRTEVFPERRAWHSLCNHL